MFSLGVLSFWIFLLWPDMILPIFGIQEKLSFIVWRFKCLWRGLDGGKHLSKISKNFLPSLVFKVLENGGL